MRILTFAIVRLLNRGDTLEERSEEGLLSGTLLLLLLFLVLHFFLARNSTLENEDNRDEYQKF